VIVDNKVLKQIPIAEGGEGIIYKYDDNNILKIYKNNVNKKEKLEKLKLLQSKKLPHDVIIPIEIVYDSNKNFIGYIMNKISGNEIKQLTNNKFLKSNNIKTDFIIGLLCNIKNVLKQLHNQDIFISDLNDGNILFDHNQNVYFIDTDSWTIDNYKCTVCMDTFKDPLLINDNFSEKTDYYAFAILSFKSLTRLHPFGGTTNPDMNLLERMKKGISVINNNNVIIPKIIKKWSYMYPKLLEEMKEIFESNKRFLIDNSLDSFNKNKKYCNIHDIFYYSKFTDCPICNENAKIIVKPIKIGTEDGIKYILLFSDNNVKVIFDNNIYLSNDGYIVERFTNKKIQYNTDNKYYFSENGNIQYTIHNININVQYNNNNYNFDKINKSHVIIKNDKVYYINNACNLVELIITSYGNQFRNITKTSFNCIFDIFDDKNYFLCNCYDNFKIINVSEYNYTLNNNDKIINYGIHFDFVTKKWLFILENQYGKYQTYIFEKNNLIYENDSIKYLNNLNNICFNNNIIFKAGDGVIKGFNYSKNIFKDFNCSIVNEDSKLIKQQSGFLIINEKEIYKVG
jgi:tRNA A-37 threonylcarbamoyl transferase component Bud32